MMRTKGGKRIGMPTTKESQKDILTPTPLHHHRHHRSQRGKTPSWIARLIAWRRRSGSCRVWTLSGTQTSQACLGSPTWPCHPSSKLRNLRSTMGEEIPWSTYKCTAGRWRRTPTTSRRHPDKACSRMVLTAEEDLPLDGTGGYLLGSIWVQLPDSSGSVRPSEDGEEEQWNLQGYAQRWREKAARARPPLDEREMIKIFVDTLKNPYFDRMIGLQMQFFVDLIPMGERIEDALKTKNSGHDGSNGIGRASC